MKRVNVNYLDSDGSDKIIAAGYRGYMWHRNGERLVPILSALEWCEEQGFSIDITHTMGPSSAHTAYIRELIDGKWVTIDACVIAPTIPGAIQGCVKRICDFIGTDEDWPLYYDFDE